jgi:predicted permease
MALGFGASALAFVLLSAFSSLQAPGMKNMSYATLAEGTEGGEIAPVSWEQYERLRQAPLPGVTLAAYSKPIKVQIGSADNRKTVSISAVSADFFSMLSSRLYAGRSFYAEEEATPGSHQVVISVQLAAELFRHPENAVEGTVLINDTPFEVVGIAPRTFRGALGTTEEAWVPANCVIPLILNLPPDKETNQSVWRVVAGFFTIAGSDRLSSNGLINTLNQSAILKHPGTADLVVSAGLTTDPVRDEKLRKWSRLGLILALIFVSVSALDVCLLLLARAPARVEEVRLRRALGASTRRLAVELTVGPAAVLLAGQCLACAIAIGALLYISHLSSFYKQLLYGSPHSFAFALFLQTSLACTVTVLVAAIPALYLFGEDQGPRLGYSSTANRRTTTIMHIPVALQIACCMATCTLAGMIASSLFSMLREPLGYTPDHLLMVSIAPPRGTIISLFSGTSDVMSPEATKLLNVINRVKNLPGVLGVSYVSNGPFDPTPLAVVKVQRDDAPSSVACSAGEVDVTPGYFNTLGSRLLVGSDFPANITGGGGHEIVVNELLARQLFPGLSPIGRTVRMIEPARSGIPIFSYTARIIGVVENTKLSGLASSAVPTLYMSILGHGFMDVRPQLVVRTTESAQSLRESVTGQVEALMPGMGVEDVYDVPSQIRMSVAPEKQRVYWALGGALTMSIMAYLGMYGALAYFVRASRRELAVRICVGASRHAIRRIVVRRALMCAIPALFLSLPLILALRQLSSNDFLGLVSWSWLRAIAISLTCVAISILVAMIPAHMATKVSPADALREQ